MRVGDEYRKNPLSLETGGDEVKVIYQGGERIYDRVKNPKAFSDKVIRNARNLEEGQRLLRIECKGKTLWEAQ
jgi:hypothetical protein